LLEVDDPGAGGTDGDDVGDDGTGDVGALETERRTSRSEVRDGQAPCLLRRDTTAACSRPGRRGRIARGGIDR
jgi:hypothetical protein